ncbi:hypothetical protein, partial [Acidipropionibacterium timonense]|uniref:hypothetical protein n=1 Tax=Acidipropionibacterium timonense TaxID=2161818 RepID=UPI001030C338
MSEWPRRAMLTASLSAGTFLLAGCYRVSPLIEGPRSGTTAATPTLGATMRRAAELEADLAATASSLARTDRSHATALAAVSAVHSAHARTLGRADPFDATSITVIDPVASSSSTPRSAMATPTRATLDRALAAAAKAHLASAVAAADPSHVLLWASLAASASASGLSPAPTVETTVSPVRIGSESLTAARQVLLSRVNALLAGLDWGVGRLLGVDQDLRAWGQERLDAVSTMRADLHAQIRESSATPTPFSPGYA